MCIPDSCTGQDVSENLDFFLRKYKSKSIITTDYDISIIVTHVNVVSNVMSLGLGEGPCDRVK